ncbi:hypothetical protein GQ600_18287 [Phytophthora cactorum]|nr:hypothetical protein GQ600_18287 [Phytophthora cactorum]
MALLARTFRTIVGLPWRSFELLDQTLRWSAVPEKVEDPTSEIWAEDLFTPCSTKCLLSTKYSYDDDTDSSGFEFNYESDICDEEDDEEWSCSESDEEVDGFSFRSDGDVDFWGTIGSGQLIMRTTMAARVDCLGRCRDVELRCGEVGRLCYADHEL